MKIYSFFVVLLFFASTLFAEELIDLEDIVQNFIVETRQVVVPGFPPAFNPSIVRWQGKLLMSFRVIDDKGKAKASLEQPTVIPDIFMGMVASSDIANDSFVGLIWLDDDLEPTSKPQFLRLGNRDRSKFCARSEDARLVIINDQLHLTFSANEDPIVTEGGFRMYVATLDYDGSRFNVIKEERLSDFIGEHCERREKNWVPFDFCTELYLAYIVKPHRILKPLMDGSGCCELMWTSRGSIVWEWGELRGGTPALYDEKTGEYLAFFHSCTMMPSAHSGGENVLHYFIGAYTFSPNPPFEIKRISPEPIVGKGFYWGKEYVPYWKPVRVVFPGGFFFDGDSLWIAYGRQDHEIWFVKIDKKGLYDSLIQVTTRKR